MLNHCLAHFAVLNQKKKGNVAHTTSSLNWSFEVLFEDFGWFLVVAITKGGSSTSAPGTCPSLITAEIIQLGNYVIKSISTTTVLKKWK